MISGGEERQAQYAAEAGAADSFGVRRLQRAKTPLLQEFHSSRHRARSSAVDLVFSAALCARIVPLIAGSFSY